MSNQLNQAAAVIGALAEHIQDRCVSTGQTPPPEMAQLTQLAQDLLHQHALDEGQVGVARHEWLLQLGRILR